MYITRLKSARLQGGWTTRGHLGNSQWAGVRYSQWVAVIKTYVNKKPVLSQEEPRDAAINFNKKLINAVNILFSCLIVPDIDAESLRLLNHVNLITQKPQGKWHNKKQYIHPQNMQNDHRIKRKIATEDHSASSVLGSVESEWMTK